MLTVHFNNASKSWKYLHSKALRYLSFFIFLLAVPFSITSGTTPSKSTDLTSNDTSSQASKPFSPQSNTIDIPFAPVKSTGNKVINSIISGYPDQRVDLTLRINDYSCRIQGKFDDKQHKRDYMDRLYSIQICEIPYSVLERQPAKFKLNGNVIQNDGKSIPVDLVHEEFIDFATSVSIQINQEGQTELHLPSACPWVYVYDGMAWQRRVEIIQNLLGKQNEKEQTVLLGKVPSQNRSVKIRIQEDKPEISYLDYIVLEIGDQKISPSLPMDHPLLEKDFQYFVLEQNEHIDLTFDIPKDIPLEDEIDITASGYYLRK